MKESDIQSKVIKDIDGFGKYVFGFKLIKANKNGIPDIIFHSLVTGGIMVEMKKPGELPDPHQDVKMDEAEYVGIRCFVIDSVKGWVALKKHLGLNIENLKNRGLKNDSGNRLAFTLRVLERASN